MVGHDPYFGKASPGKIGMWLLLATDGLSFAGFLLSYAYARTMANEWPNPIEALGGVGLSGLMTFILICSSLSMVLAVDACKREQKQNMVRYLIVTILGGMIFLGIQIFEYQHLIADKGMTISGYEHGNDHFASTFFAITGFHGLHVLFGVGYLIVMLKIAVEGGFDKGNYSMLEIAGLFWHFVDLVWILVFTFLYLV